MSFFIELHIQQMDETYQGINWTTIYQPYHTKGDGGFYKYLFPRPIPNATFNTKDQWPQKVAPLKA